MRIAVIVLLVCLGAVLAQESKTAEKTRPPTLREPVDLDRMWSFHFQGKKYCITNDYYPDVPAVGDRILIMHGNRISTSALVGISPTGLVVLPSEGPPSVGYKTIGRSGLSFESAEDVITWAKDSLTEAGKM